MIPNVPRKYCMLLSNIKNFITDSDVCLRILILTLRLICAATSNHVNICSISEESLFFLTVTIRPKAESTTHPLKPPTRGMEDYIFYPNTCCKQNTQDLPTAGECRHFLKANLSLALSCIL